MFENIIQIIEILAIVIGVAIGAWTIVRVFGREQIFEDAQDRDGTIILVLVFAAFGGLIWVFKEKVSAEVVAGLAGTLIGSISTMVQSFYRKNGDRQ